MEVGERTKEISEEATGLLKWYRQMCLIREFELRAVELFDAGEIRGSLHPYVGMEAGAVGICSELGENDIMLTYYRGHGHCLAKGLDPGMMMAEVLGRVKGYCRGKGGTMHITSREQGVLGTEAVVGGHLPMAVGAAYTLALEGDAGVGIVFFGDGAVNQGVFHESLNLARIRSVPLIFVCENNLWAVTTRSSDVTAGSIAAKAAAYDIPGEAVPGFDVEGVNAAARRWIHRAREGEGPSLLELQTYRWYPHSAYTRNDPRPSEEVELWKSQRDPIRILRSRLESTHRLTPAVLDAEEAAARRTVDEAADFALQSPLAELAEAYADCYVTRGSSE